MMMTTTSATATRRKKYTLLTNLDKTRRSASVNARGLSPTPHNRPGSAVRGGGVTPVLAGGVPPCTRLAYPLARTGVHPLPPGVLPRTELWTGPVTGLGYLLPPRKVMEPETREGLETRNHEVPPPLHTHHVDRHTPVPLDAGGVIKTT